MNSTERPLSGGTWRFLTGMASVLDLHGHSAWFEEVATTPGFGSSVGPDDDIRAVGHDLERALMLHAAALSPEDQRALARILSRLLEPSTRDLLPHGTLSEKQLELDLLSGHGSR